MCIVPGVRIRDESRVGVIHAEPGEQANLMLDYFFSKSTDVYLMIASQWANGGATQAQSSQFISPSSTNRQSTFTVGMRHKF
jgi:predicted porin